MKQYSELKIILSNCLIGGSAWNSSQHNLIDVLRQALYDTDGIEFKAINYNNVSGEHISTTITITGTFYNLNSNIGHQEMIDMEQVMTIVTQNIPDFTCSEVRIEHTRHRTSFDENVHPRLVGVAI